MFSLIELHSTIHEQEALIEALDAALLATGLDARPAPGPWLSRLTPQQRVMLSALYGVYPKCLTKEQLLGLLPCRRRDPEDRQTQLVPVLAARLRGLFGKDAIENVYGVGLRLGHEFYSGIPKHELA